LKVADSGVTGAYLPTFGGHQGEAVAKVGL